MSSFALDDDCPVGGCIIVLVVGGGGDGGSGGGGIMTLLPPPLVLGWDPPTIAVAGIFRLTSSSSLSLSSSSWRFLFLSLPLLPTTARSFSTVVGIQLIRRAPDDAVISVGRIVVVVGRRRLGSGS